MEIYLIQHAQSKSREEDPARPLSNEGKQAIERVAKYVAQMGLILDRIYHSGKLRAYQTAEILAHHLRIDERVEARQGLDPLDDVKPTLAWLNQQAANGVKALAIVGHLPFLDKLASSLIVGNEAAGVVAFQYGGIVKLTPRREGRGYAVQWILTPELARPT
jgi:phosphohistidine phosphatase